MGKCCKNEMTQFQHLQHPTKKDWATFPMLNFSQWTPTLGASLKWMTKCPKIAHFGIFIHIGGVGGGQKNVDLKIQWVKGNCSKNCGYWASWGPTLIFSEKKTSNVRITVHLDIYPRSLENCQKSKSFSKLSLWKSWNFGYYSDRTRK